MDLRKSNSGCSAVCVPRRGLLLPLDCPGARSAPRPAAGSPQVSPSLPPPAWEPPRAEVQGSTPAGTAGLKTVQLHVMGIVKAPGGAAPLPAPGELGKGKNYGKPACGTHHLTVVHGSLGLVGAIGAAAPAFVVAAVRRGPAALEDGGGGAGALPAPARCSAHAYASAARSRPRARAAP